MSAPASKTEVDRLGRRGSYRLGSIAVPGSAGPSPGRPYRPSFARPRHRGPALAWILASIAGTALIAWGAQAGLWFAPFVIGLATGILVRWGGWRLRVTVPAALLMAAGGWALALWLPALAGLPVGATARTVAALAGLPASAAAGIAAALAVSVLQGLTGLWLGRAIAPRSAHG
jgi:hypothetical protein